MQHTSYKRRTPMQDNQNTNEQLKQLSDQLPDQSARQHAVNIRQSCVVSAPAGSGKTGLLTQRVLTLLGVVQKPEEILCITFTRKAANEMRERVFDVLMKAAELTDNNALTTDVSVNSYEQERLALAQKALQQSKKYEWDLLNNKYRLKILTIDGFCKSLSARLPFLSSMGINAGIFDDASSAYKEAVNLWLTDKIADNSNELKQLATLFHGNINRLTDLLSSLLSVREQWLPLTFITQQNLTNARDYFESIISELVSEAVEDAMLCIQNYEGDLCAIGQFAAQQLHDAGSDSPITSLIHAEEFADSSDQGLKTFWWPLCQILLTNDGEFRKALDKRIGFPPGSSKEEKEFFKTKKQQLLQIIGELKELPNSNVLLHALRSLPQQTFSETQWRTLSQVVTVLPELVAYLNMTFAKYKKADFTEYTLAALRALNGIDGDMALQQRFDYQLKHILIDEFQDTSQPQLDLLNLLTQEWQPDDGKTVFLVGDGMQSCYAFRNANVGIFLNTKQHGLPAVTLNPLDLSVNFRSNESIVNWVNHTFAQLFPREDNATKGAVHYSPSVAFHKQTNPDDISNVLCEYFALPKDESSDGSSQAEEVNSPHKHRKNTDNTTQESLAIAQKIMDYRENDTTQSIAILAKNRSQFASIVTALAQYNIPYVAIDIDPLLSKQPIVDLLSLTKVIVDPSDRIAWISLLRSPWCALNFHDLSWLANFDLCDHSGQLNIKSKISGFPPLYIQLQHAEKIPHLSDDGLAALQKLRGVLNPVFEQRQRRTLAASIETAWSQLGGAYTLNSESDLDDVNTFLQRVDHFDNAGTIENWQDFINDINKLYAQPAATEVNPVQLLTMHKSKGLEFDIVFLPSLEKIGRGDDAELLYWHEHLNSAGENHFVLSPIDVQGLDDTEDAKHTPNNSISQFIRKIKKEKSDLETMRLLYVACTRAKKQLHLSATLKTDEENNIHTPAKNSLLAKIWPSLADQFILAAPIVPIQETNSTKTQQPLSPYIRRLILPNDLSTPTSSTDKNLDDAMDNQANIEKSNFNNQDFDLIKAYQHSQTLERDQGVFIHRLLKILCESDFSTWNQHKIHAMQSHWRAQLAQYGLTKQQSDQMMMQTNTCIDALLKDDTAKWIFDNSHQHSANELSIWWQGQEKIIDRTFIHDNTRWIIDYKTSTPGDTSKQVFCATEKRKYHEQMQAYELLLREYDKEHGITGKGQELAYQKALYFPFITELSLYE